MMRRPAILTLFILLIASSFSQAQALSSYYDESRFLFAPPTSFQTGLLGFINPANLALLSKSESQFYWSTERSKTFSIQDWGISSAVRGLGFGVLRQRMGESKVKDYRLATGFGTGAFAIGFGYGWSTGNVRTLGRESLFSTGAVIRPHTHVSIGLTGKFSLESDAREGIFEVGLRPLGTPRLLLFADAALQTETRLWDAPWSAGAALELADGIHLAARTLEAKGFTMGLSVNFGKAGIGGQASYDDDRHHAFNTYTARLGGMQPSVFPTLGQQGKRYVAFKLKGRVDYQKYALFDRNTHRLMDLLRDIRAASDDPRIGALALNLSAMRVLPEHAWEIRHELQHARMAGKKVIIFIDQAGMTSYHLASVADKIVMDPEGSFMLEGYVLGRTYLKGTLEKLGLGFDEWRFFEYKSAVEALSRDQMSDADRRQVQDFIDDWYETVRAEICEARNFSEEKFERLINEEVFFLPEVALAEGLVDTLARWSSLDDIMKKVNGAKLRKIERKDLLANALPLQQWGETRKIAVVYGIGECAMDEGIRARWLERVFIRLTNDNSVKAVVFRVDSPGGDGMASDLVAEAMLKCSRKKPVIVSQGQVAGSGGYWISMYADTILAGPNTITGSIGVIGGWIYDKGFSEKIGMTSDHVQRGAHADLGFGVRLPFLGLEVPARNLTEEERLKVEGVIRKFYDVFVQKVAKGRDLPEDEVRKIAEGHIYSGIDGKANGLVDEVGGLLAALAIAQEKAGLTAEDEFEIIEVPDSKGLLNLTRRLVSTEIDVAQDPVIQFIKRVSKNAGRPLPLLEPGMYPRME